MKTMFFDGGVLLHHPLDKVNLQEISDQKLNFKAKIPMSSHIAIGRLWNSLKSKFWT